MVTLKDIAKEANTSICTASLVLNGKHRDRHISDKVANRVLELAKKRMYRPNFAAKAVKSGRYEAVSFLVGSHIDGTMSWFPRELLINIAGELNRNSIDMSLTHLPDEVLTNKDMLPKILTEHKTDGLLVNYIEKMPETFVCLAEQYLIPTVYINVKRPHDSVYCNDIKAVNLAIDHLMGLGHTRIGFIGTEIKNEYSHYPTSC